MRHRARNGSWPARRRGKPRPDGSPTGAACCWVRTTAGGSGRTVLTSGQHEHGEPGGGWGYAPVPSPDGCRFVHVEVREGLVDLLVGELPDRAAGIAPSRRSRRSSQGVGKAALQIASSVALAEPPDGLSAVAVPVAGLRS